MAKERAKNGKGIENDVAECSKRGSILLLAGVYVGQQQFCILNRYTW